MPETLPDPRTHDVRSGKVRRLTVHLQGYGLLEPLYMDLPATLPIGQLIAAARAFSAASRERRLGPHLWIRAEGETKQIGAEPLATPIGELLEAEQMHILTLAYEAPPIRGT